MPLFTRHRSLVPVFALCVGCSSEASGGRGNGTLASLHGSGGVSTASGGGLSAAPAFGGGKATAALGGAANVTNVGGFMSVGVGGASAAVGGAGAAAGGADAMVGSAGGVGTGGSAVGSGLVPVFVAQGHEGRTTISCDAGQSWILNHSEDDNYRCFTEGMDCDHSEFAGRGLAFGKDAFVATWGWGHPGSVARTEDGATWTPVLTNAPNFADIAYGAGRFVACSNPVQVSTDGVNWVEGGRLTFDFNYRGIEYVPTAGGLFVVSGESGDSRAISFSSDAGKTWHAPTTRPDECGAYLRGIAGNATTIVVASGQGHLCFSNDGAVTWQLVKVTDGFSSQVIWTGSEFRIYQGSTLWQSVDGEHWSSLPIEPNNIAIGAFARSPDGIYVAANDGWMVWYEKQQFFRSADGIHWTVLDNSKFVGSHPINYIEFGYVKPGAGCP